MPDETPGTSPADPAATETAPQTTGAPPQDAQPTGSPSTATSDPYAEFPENVRDKVKEREKAAAEEAVKRAKAGAEGGWLSSVPPELREELKRDPAAYWRIKAENEALKGIVGNGKVLKEPASDPVEEVYKWADEEVKKRPDLTVSDLNRIQIQAADRISQIRSKQAAKDAYPALSNAERERQVNVQPEMQHVAFNAMYHGMKTRLESMGKAADPYAAFQMAKQAWSDMFPNAPISQKPAPSLPSADTKRTPAPPAQPALSPREKWLKSDGARGLQDD